MSTCRLLRLLFFFFFFFFPLVAMSFAAGGGGGGGGPPPLRHAHRLRDGDGVETIHDFLPQFGMPRGLLPNSVRNFSRTDDGEFLVELEAPCYVQFSDLVYYERTVRGRISYGVISDLSGIQAKKFFVWVSVTNIVADTDGGGMIEFDAAGGFFSEKLPADQFSEVPTCGGTITASSSSDAAAAADDDDTAIAAV